MQHKAEIPYGAYWSTPFARWQGAFSNLHSIEFAAHVTKAELACRKIPADVIDHGVMGISVPQKHAFYGLPWLAGMAGLDAVAGPTIMQACATGARVLLTAAQEIDAGMSEVSLIVTCDRTSNGPHLYYPNPRAPGGTGAHEDWVMDNFNCDPLGGHAMVQTAENVAAKHQITTSEQHDVVLRREAQYRQALADDFAFHKRFMTLPFQVPDPSFRKTVATLASDEGIRLSSAEELAKLKPVVEGGTVTYGGQTHPADANAGMIVATAERARELSRDPKIRIQLRGFGSARAAPAYMPEAPIPAAQRALEQAGLGIDAHGRDQDAQSVRVERRAVFAADRRRPRSHEQLRLLAGLGTSAGADGNAGGHRTDRGTGHSRRRLRPVHRMRGRRFRDGRRHRSQRRIEAAMDLAHWIERSAAFTPDSLAIRFAGQDLDYAGFAGRVRRSVDRLAALGVQPGDRVAYLGRNHPEMLALLFACARCSAIVVPLNWRHATPEHARVLADCTPRAILVDAAFTERATALREVRPGVVWTTLGDVPAGWTGWDDLAPIAATGSAQRLSGSLEDPVLVCYTSGSTGTPKGVVLTQSALFWNALNSAHMHDMTSADRILTTLPLFHVGGLNILTLPALHAGANVDLARAVRTAGGHRGDRARAHHADRAGSRPAHGDDGASALAASRSVQPAHDHDRLDDRIAIFRAQRERLRTAPGAGLRLD